MSNEKSETAISEKKNTSVAVPSAFLDDANSGLETLTADDITIPRLKVLQAMSPEVMKSDSSILKVQVQVILLILSPVNCTQTMNHW